MTFSELWLYLTMLWVGLKCVIVVFPDHTDFLIFRVTHLAKTYLQSNWSLIQALLNTRNLSTKSHDVGTKKKSQLDCSLEHQTNVRTKG